MDLFVVNRYDESKQNVNEKEREDIFLKSLQEKIEKKRKKEKKLKIEEAPIIEEEHEKLLEICPVEEEIIVEEKTVKKKKKDKNRSIEEEVKEPENNVEEPENNVEEPVKKSDFVVLGDDHFTKLKTVGIILPPWLKSPTIIETDLSQKGRKIKKLKYLRDEIKQNLKKMGFERFFPVQEQVVPWVLDVHSKPAPFWPRDVCISSPTGSGKTLAFAIPIVQLLLDRISPSIRALIMLPVQELAEQVANVFEKLCEGTKLKSILLSKIRPFHIEQFRLVEKFNGKCYQKVDIVITTAGRLVEHLHSTEGFSLNALKFLVIDEADRVMDQIQNDWLYHLNKNVKTESDDYLIGRNAGKLSQTELFDKPRQPHKLLFSATLSQDPEKLQTFKLFHPKLFAAIVEKEEQLEEVNEENEDNEEKRGTFVGKYTTPAELKEFICVSGYKIKPLTLFTLIKENNYKKFLVFTKSTLNAHRLSFILQKLFGNELTIEEWSSSLTVSDRKTVLNRFILGKVQGIICTDALARGMHIDDIDVVFSYDIPQHIKTYIHRIGRTGRAGNQGTSITLLEEIERMKFENFLAEAGKNNIKNIEIKSNIDELYAAKYAKTLSELQVALDLEKQVTNKLKSGFKINSLHSGNLLGQLKNQAIGAEVNTNEIIRNVTHLPKSWTNECIERWSMKTTRGAKEKLKRQRDKNVEVNPEESKEKSFKKFKKEDQE